MTAKIIPFFLIPALLCLAVFTVSCTSGGKRPAGRIDGRLAPCPERPNCVSSEAAGGPSAVEPLAFTVTPQAAWAALKRAVAASGGQVAREDSDFLWAVFRTPVFRFKDDVEFRMDAARMQIHVRSASRSGYSDFGVNRRRVEKLRRQFEQELKAR
jgi:uncharacterized protein (DUF1499 family)